MFSMCEQWSWLAVQDRFARSIGTKDALNVLAYCDNIDAGGQFDVGLGRDAPAHIEDTHAARQFAAQLDISNYGPGCQGMRHHQRNEAKHVLQIEPLDTVEARRARDALGHDLSQKMR